MQMFSGIAAPEHRRQLRDSVIAYAARNATPAQIRATAAAPAALLSERWQEICDNGWTSLMIPEARGGIGLGAGDLSAFHQELGRAAMRDPLIEIAAFAGELLLRADQSAAAEPLLDAVLAGEALLGVAWQAHAAALEPSEVGPVAEAVSGGWQLSGRAEAVALAGVATGLLVAARTKDGVAIFHIATVPDAVAKTELADGTVVGAYVFDGVTLDQTALLCSPTTGEAALGAALDVARLACSAQLLGLAEKALSTTTDYLKTRQQFGQPLGHFQALQHRCVDLYVQVEIARSSLARAEAAFDTATGPEITRAVSAAKCRCSETARDVARAAIQLHGAIGYTDECDLSLLVTRILALSARLGAASAHRQRWLDGQFDQKGDRHVA